MLLTLVTVYKGDAAPLSATYTYDGRGRLVSVTYDGGKTITYTYDAAGNRVREVVTAPSSASAPAPVESPVLSEAGKDAAGG
ncbi:MAG: RHS repeat protein [Defluviicoccus sp.]|nr:MAG: RHS repeat protein [Defluviicoccus sp.]